MLNTQKYDLDMHWKKLIKAMSHHKPIQVILIPLFLLFLTAMMLLATLTLSGSWIIVLRIMLLATCLLYLAISIVVFFLLKSGDNNKGRPRRRSWIYRMADTLSIYFSSEFLLISCFMIGNFSTYLSPILAEMRYYLVIVYFLFVPVIWLLSPAIIRNRINRGNKSSRLGMAAAIKTAAIIGGMGIAFTNIMLRTGNSQVLFIISSLSMLFIAFFLLCIAVSFSFELALLISGTKSGF